MSEERELFAGGLSVATYVVDPDVDIRLGPRSFPAGGTVARRVGVLVTDGVLTAEDAAGQ